MVHDWLYYYGYRDFLWVSRVLILQTNTCILNKTNLITLLVSSLFINQHVCGNLTRVKSV